MNGSVQNVGEATMTSPSGAMAMLFAAMPKMLAFVGGRDTAAELLQRWRQQARAAEPELERAAQAARHEAQAGGQTPDSGYAVPPQTALRRG